MGKKQFNFAEEFFHHSRLFWETTTIFTTVISGLYLYILRYNQESLLNLFGFILTGMLVWFAVSFRILKQHALARALLEGQLIKNRIHLDQWWPYIILWWVIGLLYLINMENISNSFSQILLTILIVVWTIFVLLFAGGRHYMLKELKSVMEHKAVKNRVDIFNKR